MQELRETSGDTGLFSNITDEEIEEAKERDKEDPLPEAGSQLPGEEQQPDENAGELDDTKTPVKALDSIVTRLKKFIRGNK